MLFLSYGCAVFPRKLTLYSHGASVWMFDRRVFLKLGADATVIVTTANHITFLYYMLHEHIWQASALGYLHLIG